jgi:hypothetical protein
MLQIVEEEWEAVDEGFMPLYTELRLECATGSLLQCKIKSLYPKKPKPHKLQGAWPLGSVVNPDP